MDAFWVLLHNSKSHATKLTVKKMNILDGESLKKDMSTTSQHNQQRRILNNLKIVYFVCPIITRCSNRTLSTSLTQHLICMTLRQDSYLCHYNIPKLQTDIRP